MNRGNFFRRNVFAAFVALGVLLAAVVGATVKLYNVSAEDYPSEVESMDISKQRALEKAVKKAKKEAGVYLKTYSRSVNSELTDDEITAITSNAWQLVGEPKFTREIVNHSDETSIIVWKVNVAVQVDDSEIQSWIKRDDKEKSTIISQTREANEASDENERQIEYLREEYNRATSQAEKDFIRKQIKDVEREYLVNKKFEEGNKLYFSKNYNGAIKIYDELLKFYDYNYMEHKRGWSMTGSDGTFVAYNKDREIKCYILAYNNRGESYRLLGQYERAIQDYDKAIELNPNFFGAYNNRGCAYYQLEQYERAIQNFAKTIQLNPNYSDAYTNRGNAYLNLGQNELAIQDYSKAIELNPNLYQAYNNRGCAYYQLEQYERAIQDYSKAIELNPNYIFAYNGRGDAYLGLGQYERAIQDYSKAIELNPNGAKAYNSRGWAYYCLKQYKKALKDFEKALELNPNLTQAKNNREHCLKAMGK